MTLNHPSAYSASLTGQVAVVTGSTSGIGRAIALELARQGAEIVIHGRSQSKAEELAAEIKAIGRQAEIVLGDLSDTREHCSLVEAAWSWRGGVDIWINNAGADVLTGAAAHWSFEQKLARLWQVDVLATIALSRLVGKQMQECGRGVIVNIGWDQAEQGMAGESGEMFATVKGAVMAFTRSLAQSLAPQVRVNCLAPGWIKTSWGADASPYWQARAERESLRGRWGEPSDVARAAAYLVSPGADFITGQTIAVNGGFRFAVPPAAGE
jgi:3-oxoacyl-[acyl-carrier protein] reductase